MALDYILKFPCEVRKHTPEAKLIVLVGYKSIAEFYVAEIHKSDPSLPMETILSYEVHANQLRPDGVTKQSPMTLEQLFALVQPIEKYTEHCKDCPSNIANRPFGCFAKINYPISKEAEEWLLSRLPTDADDPNLLLLLRFLSDLEIDGHVIDSMRDTLCELKNPVVRRWESIPNQKQVSSSQIIQMLGFGGKIKSSQAMFYTEVLGLASVLTESHPPSSHIEQFKTLMCAIVMSGRLNAEINFDT